MYFLLKERFIVTFICATISLRKKTHDIQHTVIYNRNSRDGDSNRQPLAWLRRSDSALAHYSTMPPILILI